MSSAFNIPAGWREAIAEIRNGLNDATPSAFDNSGYRDYAGIVLDAVEEELSALAAAPPVDAVPGEPVALPHPGGAEISALLDSILAEYNWPTNTKNAARAGWTAAMRYLAASVASRAGSEPVPGRTQKRYKIGEPLKEAPLPEGWLDDYITAEAGLKKHEVPGVYFVQGVRFAEAHYDVAGREKYRLNPGQEQWVRDAITDAYEAGARAQIDGTRHVGKHTRQAAKHFIGAINDCAAAAPIAPAAAAEPSGHLSSAGEAQS